MRRAVLLMALFLAGCESCGCPGLPLEDTPAVDTPARSARGISSPATSGRPRLVTYAELEATDAPLPARYAAPLPTLAALEQTDTYPPADYIDDLLCAGDVEMQRRFDAALTAAAEAGAGSDALAEGYQSLLPRWCEDDAMCEWAVRRATTASPASLRPVYWQALTSCPAELVRPALARAPARAVVRWYGNQFGGVESGPELARALLATVNELDPFELRLGAIRLGERDSPETAETLLRLHALADTPERQRVLTIAMFEQSHPVAKQLFDAACAEQFDTMCPREDGFDYEPPPEGSVDSDIDSLESWLTERPRKRRQLLNDLARCAREPDEEQPWRQDRCLRNLAHLDRARAVALAREITDPEGRLGVLPATLVKFSQPGSLEARLVELGLLASTPTYAGRPPLTAEDVLMEAGRVHLFDTETGMFPNEHQRLMRRLARMVTPALEGVYYEEVPPETDEDGYTVEGSGYQLIAYADGKRFTTPAEDHGDWYDVEATLGMLNSLLRQRKRPERFVMLMSWGQEAIVLGAPLGAIRKAQREGLLDFGAASDSMEQGKAFEQQVLEQLESGELELE